MFTKFHRECDQFYIGLNTRILKKIKEHARRKYSNAYKRAKLNKYVISFLSPEILALDTMALRLHAIETLYIREHEAHKSQNGNLGNFAVKQICICFYKEKNLIQSRPT